MIMAEPVEVNESNWDEQVLKSELPVLVDFWAEWCGPCKMIAPSVHDLAVEYDGKLSVGKLDVDSNPNIATKYGIRSIPALIFFKNGKPVDQIIGAVPKGVLKRKVDTVLSS
jgi:thioredoxin 1